MEEKIAQEGLDIKGYNGKWKAAKRLAEFNERTDDYHILPYWERVRLLFLELDGRYVDQNERDKKRY